MDGVVSHLAHRTRYSSENRRWSFMPRPLDFDVEDGTAFLRFQCVEKRSCPVSVESVYLQIAPANAVYVFPIAGGGR